MKNAFAILLVLAAAVPISAQDDLKAQAKKMKIEMTNVRGLGFKTDVNVGVYTKAELLKFIEEMFEKELPRPKAKRFQQSYAHFRLIPDDLDLYSAIIELLSESIAGFYDPQSKELRLVREEEESEDHQALKAIGIDWNEVVLVHELTHAAQDQNFDLRTLPMEEETNDDMVAALKALTEGEAWIVGWKHGIRQNFELMIRQFNEMYKTAQMPGKAGQLPRYLRETQMFPYGYGGDFVLEILEAQDWDWEYVTKMYEDLPSSTEQVLHPKKYYEKRDYPTVITLPELGGWTRIDNNVLGEFSIRILLAELKAGSKKDREKAAAGWDGDRYHIYEKDGRVSGVWYTTWDSEKDAEEFFKAYLKALRTKYKKAKEEEVGDTKVVLATSDSSGVRIERKGVDVLVLDGDADLQKSAGKIWDGAKKEELKEVKRFLFQKGGWTCPKHPKVEKDLNSYCTECGARLVAKEGTKREYR